MTELSEKENILQQIITDRLNLFIPNELIKLICEPLLHDVVEYGRKQKCFYREQFIKTSFTTEYLVLRKIKVELQFEDLWNSTLRIKFVQLYHLVKKGDHNRNSFIVKFMIPKNKYNILLTNDKNIPLILNDGSITKQSAMIMPKKSKLAKFICSPMVRPHQVNIHFNITYSKLPSQPIYISYYVYDIVAMRHLD